jgi:GTP-binding protein
VGKSTLISVVSNARPVIADYHFTTLVPVLGVVSMGTGTSFVVADIPGLIEGAHEGVGLGHEFLRHIERCRMFVHVVDAAGSEGRSPVQDFEAINKELAAFDPALLEKPQLVAANKTDLAAEGTLREFEEYIRGKGYEYFPVVAPIAEGTQALLNRVAALLHTLPPVKQFEAEGLPAEYYEKKRSKGFEITQEDGVYIVEAPWLTNVFADVNFEDYESLQYLQRVLRSSGIIDALVEKGICEGDTVRIYDVEFDYVN